MGRRHRLPGVGLLGDLFGGLAVVAVVLIWRLAAAPIMLEPLAPHIEAALDGLDDELSFEVGVPHLRLSRSERMIELVVSEVSARGEGGEVVIELPEVEVDLSMSALLGHGLLAPRRLEARAPMLALTRRIDGTIGLRGSRGAGAGIDLRDLAAVLAGPRRGDHPLDHLEAIGISGARILLEDEASGRLLEAGTGEVALLREAERVQGRLSLGFDQGDHEVRLTALASWDPAGDRIEWRVQVRDLAPDDLAELLPEAPLDLAGIDLLVDAVVSGEASLGGDLGAIDVHLTSEDGTLRLPGILAQELALDALEVRGRLAADREELVVEELLVTSRGARIAAAATMSWRDGLSLLASARAADVAVADLERLWPQTVARGARAWVLPNISGGRVPAAEVTIELRPGDLDQRPLREDAVRGAFDYRDLTVHYYRPLPPITGIDGRATFNARGLTFAVAAGRVDDLVIEDGSVVITGIGVPGRDTTQLEVRAGIVGPLDQALDLINREPLAFTRELGIDPAASSGHSRTDLRIGLPLHDDTRDGDVWVDARATISEVAVSGLLGEVDIADGNFALHVTTAAMHLEGRGVIRGVPLDLGWEEQFGAGREIDRRYQIVGRLAPLDFASLGVQLPLPVDGEVGLDAEVLEAGGTRWIDLTLDLAAAALEVPALEWRKAPGELGSLEATVTMAREGAVEVGRFDFGAAGLRATGQADLDRETYQPLRIDLDRFELGQQSLAAGIVSREGGGYQVQARARRLDLGPLLGDREGWAGEPEPLPLEIDLVAERVLMGEAELRDVSAALLRNSAGWRTVDLALTLPGGGNLTLTLLPEGNGQRLRLMADDAGDLLRAAGQGRRIEGGALSVNAMVRAQQPALQAEGTLRMRHFTLHDMPVVARLLTLASLTGMRDVLGGEGLSVDRLEVPFRLEHGLLTISDGRLSGSQLGLTFQGTIDLERDQLDLEGTIVPIYTLNRIIGQIPILGDFLTGRDGEGAFAATFTMQGPRENPRIAVNPLAVLAPGFIRELFSGLADGSLEPPEPGR